MTKVEMDQKVANAMWKYFGDGAPGYEAPKVVIVPGRVLRAIERAEAQSRKLWWLE